jgi:hypothetical protein
MEALPLVAVSHDDQHQDAESWAPRQRFVLADQDLTTRDRHVAVARCRRDVHRRIEPVKSTTAVKEGPGFARSTRAPAYAEQGW